MKYSGVLLLFIALMAPLASCGGGGTAKETTVILNHEILSPGGEPYRAELEIAGVIIPCVTYEGSEEVTLGQCGKMNARFLADPETGSWIEFTDVEIFCNKLTYIWVGLDNGVPAIWTYVDSASRPPVPR